MAALPENGHWRVQCARLEARDNIFYFLHTTGHTQYNLIQCKTTLIIIIIIKRKQSTPQINGSFKTCFLISASSAIWLLSTWKGPKVIARNLPLPPLLLSLPSQLIVFAQLEAKLICSIFRWLKQHSTPLYSQIIFNSTILRNQSGMNKVKRKEAT